MIQVSSCVVYICLQRNILCVVCLCVCSVVYVHDYLCVNKHDILDRSFYDTVFQ